MLAPIAVVGSGISSTEESVVILTAVTFHLVVLVLFKLGAFLVITHLETEGKGHSIEHLHGLGNRDPNDRRIDVSVCSFVGGVPLCQDSSQNYS